MGTPNHQTKGVKVECVSIGEDGSNGLWISVKKMNGLNRSVFIPHSQCNQICRNPRNADPYIYVTLWLARKEGFPV